VRQSVERIIIIDDEVRMCESLATLLTSEGYQVDAFQSPVEAAEAVRHRKIDLVITDFMMPDMDGIEIMKLIKKVDEEIPVILMTGFASLNSALEAIQQGAYDYLLKPVEFTQLSLAVKRALEKRRSQIERNRLIEELKLSNMLQQRRINELDALYEAGKSIGSTANLHVLLRQIVVLAANVTEAQVASVMILDNERKFLTIAAAIGVDPKIVSSTRLPVGESIAGHVAESGEPLIIADVETDDRFKRINKERYGAASLLCAPLIIKNRVIGVINMANKADGAPFDPDDLRLLTTFASQAAVAVDDANQFERNRRRLIEFEMLHEVAAGLPRMRSFGDFRNLLVANLQRVFPIDYAIWLTWEPPTNSLVADGASGATTIPLTESGGIDLRKIDRDGLVIKGCDFRDVDLSDTRTLTNLIVPQLGKNNALPHPKGAAMAVPVLRFGELAHIVLFAADGLISYGDDDISLAKLVVSQAALLFEKERSLLNSTRLLTMGNMISEISHDLRKPLTSIRGGLQLIKQKFPEIAETEYLKTAEEEIHHMNELVRELVDFSNPNKYQTQKVDLRELIRRASELVGPDLDKRKITYSMSFVDAPWHCIVNKNQILEVFLNLFLNAVDSMPSGGRLTVEGVVERPEHKKDDYLAIKVIDSGSGIRKEHLTRVFERYFTTKADGTGLGLAVVERIISAHKGTLKVESEEGKGTTFTAYLPIEP
jgi:signal transduction histidine kinase/FixJ family two-component response regulator/putative methionine-R-sulfoxide reductase with GAF domain